MRRAVMFTFVAVGLLAGAACTPPPGPSAPLPSGVGVQWVRDTGGTIDPDGRYLAAYDRYSVLDGVVSGPTAAGTLPDPRPPLASPFAFGRVLPDGTAMFPYNGFAGEGITGTEVSGIITMTFPGGTCRISRFDNDYFAVFPSPDGAKAAVQTSNTDASSTDVTIVSLVDGGECPEVVTHQTSEPSGYGQFTRAPVVWSPSSNAVVYGVVDTGPDPATLRLVRLDAAPAASPVVVIPPSGVQILNPLGWSVAGRLLVQTTVGSKLVLATLPAGGGSLRILSDLDPADYTAPLPQATFFWTGYFAPGSSTVVYMDPLPEPSPSGGTYPWFRIRRIADQSGATSFPLTSPKPPLLYHAEAIDTISGPPYTLVYVPNSEVLERFVH